MKRSFFIALTLPFLLLAACDNGSDQAEQQDDGNLAARPPIDKAEVDFIAELKQQKPQAKEPEAAPEKTETEEVEEATPANLELSPSFIDLGQSIVGQIAETKSVILQNTGETPARIVSIVAEKSSVIADHDCPTLLGAMETCNINVTARTDVPAAALTDNIVLQSDAANAPIVLVVTGVVFDEEKSDIDLPPTMEELIARERLRRLQMARSKTLSDLYADSVNINYRSVSEPEPPKGTYQVSDDDYTQLQGIKAVYSTLPVNNCRIMKEGTRINATLDTSVLNEQESPVRAIAYQNIVSPCGNILVPAGSEILGTAFVSKDDKDSRLMIVWHRIFRAKDNASIVFEGNSADGAGRGGIPGIVYQRIQEKYGLTAALIGMSALISYLTPADDDQLSAAVSDAQQKFGQLTAQTLQNAIDTKSIIEGAKGSMIQVIAHMQDIYFPEPKLIPASR